MTAKMELSKAHLVHGIVERFSVKDRPSGHDRFEKTDPRPVSCSWGKGGGEDCGVVSRASSHERIATRSGATTMPAKTSGYLSRRRRADRSREMVPTQLPRWKWWNEAVTWISPCRKVFSGSCAASHTISQCSWASKNAPEWKQRKPSDRSPQVQSSGTL